MSTKLRVHFGIVIIAASAALRAATGIGDAGAVDINVTTLAFSNDGMMGDVNITDVAGGLTIGTVDGLAMSNNDGGGGTIQDTGNSRYDIEYDLEPSGGSASDSSGG